MTKPNEAQELTALPESEGAKILSRLFVLLGRHLPPEALLSAGLLLADYEELLTRPSDSGDAGQMEKEMIVYVMECIHGKQFDSDEIKRIIHDNLPVSDSGDVEGLINECWGHAKSIENEVSAMIGIEKIIRAFAAREPKPEL